MIDSLDLCGPLATSEPRRIVRAFRLIHRSYPVALAAFSSMGLLACPSPNLYSTPRTVAPGKVVHTLAAEGLSIRKRDSAGLGPSFDGVTFPVYGARLGIVDRVDLGFRYAGSATFGVDPKIWMIKGPIDVAVNPAAHCQTAFMWGWEPNPHGDGGSSNKSAMLRLYFPLVLGWELSRWATIVATPGAAWGADLSGRSGEDGWMARSGLGLNLVGSSRVSFQPEVTWLRTLDRAPRASMVVFGLGVSFGELPENDQVPHGPGQARRPTATSAIR